MLRQALSICGLSCATAIGTLLVHVGPHSSHALGQTYTDEPVAPIAAPVDSLSRSTIDWSIEPPAQPHVPTYRGPAQGSTAASKLSTAEGIALQPEIEELDLRLPTVSSPSGSLAQATPAPQAAPIEPQLTPQLQELRTKVRKALAIYERKHLNAESHSPWEIMHGFIGYGLKTQIYRDGPGSEPVNAISFLSWEGRGRGQALVYRSGDRIEAAQGPGVQGHPGQFLAMLAQCKVSPKSPMRAGGKDFTVLDLIESEKLGCQPHSELTFRLIALTHYLPTDTTWKSNEGLDWSIPRLIQEEIRQPIQGAACGGTHRLFGLSYAYKMREKRGEPVTGEYLRAKKYINEYQRYTFSTLQNPDGSFSTEWFARAGDREDNERKLQTTGHILEWLAFSLTDQQLQDPRTQKAVKFLAELMASDPDHHWSIGPLGHAVHALVMYDQRVFRAPALPTKESVANAEPRVSMAPPKGIPLPAKLHEAMVEKAKQEQPISARRHSPPATEENKPAAKPAPALQSTPSDDAPPTLGPSDGPSF